MKYFYKAERVLIKQYLHDILCYFFIKNTFQKQPDSTFLFPKNFNLGKHKNT
jgi:hypothetical protein